MLLKSILKEVYLAQKEYFENRNVGQERFLLNDINIDSNFISIITGIRRCGKSTLLKQFVNKLGDNVWYLNFEDPRLVSFEFDDFTKLMEIIDELDKGAYLVFDEIQNIPKWEIFIRAQQDYGRKIIITGSNASLLSKELGTKLTGRHLDYELFPFSYNEFLLFTKEKKSPDSFDKYLKSGGFPEYLKYQDQEILYRLSDDILYRDIAIRHGIKNHRLLKQLLGYLITNSGKIFSYNKLKKLFSVGSPNTIIDYISYFEDSYLLFTIPKFSYSLKKQIYNPRKVYSIDTGLINTMSLSFSKDMGRKLENVVFIYLRKKYSNIYYFAERNECDFLIFEKGEITKAIQVCNELTTENVDRELNGLWEAMEFTHLSSGLIITFDQEDFFKKGAMEIKVLPAWKFVE